MRAGSAVVLGLVFLGTGAVATAIAQRAFPGDLETAIPFGEEQTASLDLRRPESRVLRWNETIDLTSAQRWSAWVQVPWSLTAPVGDGRVETFVNISVNGQEGQRASYNLMLRHRPQVKTPAVESQFDRSGLARGANHVEVTISLKVKEHADTTARFAAAPLLLRGVEEEGRDPPALLLIPWGVAAAVTAGTGLALRGRGR